MQGQGGGTGLADEGREQVRAAVAALPEQGRPRGVVTSDLLRCRQTADPLASALGLPVRVDAALRERCFGALEGDTWDDAHRRAAGLVGSRVADPTVRPLGGESVGDLAARAVPAVRAALSAGPGPVLVVTHGGPVRVTLACLAGLPLRDLAWGDVPHATPLPVCTGACGR